MRNSSKKSQYYWFLLTILISLLSSCRFTSGDDSFVVDPGSSSFVYYGEALPDEYLWNVISYDTYAYAADGSNKFSVYDILSPTNPMMISTFSLDSGTQPIKQMVSDNRYNIFIAAGNGGLFVVNTSNPSFPVSVFNDNSLFASGLDLYDDYLVVLNNNGWKLFYVTTSSQLTELSSYSYFIDKKPLKVKFLDNWLFVLTDVSLDIFDVSNLSNIVLERSILFTGTIDFAVFQNFVAVVTERNLYFVDINMPLYAEIVRYYELEWRPISINFQNQYMFISWVNRNLSAYRINSLNSISEISRMQMTQPIHDISFSQNYLYLANGLNGLKVYYFLDF